MILILQISKPTPLANNKPYPLTNSFQFWIKFYLFTHTARPIPPPWRSELVSSILLAWNSLSPKKFSQFSISEQLWQHRLCMRRPSIYAKCVSIRYRSIIPLAVVIVVFIGRMLCLRSISCTSVSFLFQHRHNWKLGSWSSAPVLRRLPFFFLQLNSIQRARWRTKCVTSRVNN